METIISKQIEGLNNQRQTLIRELSELDPHIQNYSMKENTLNSQIIQIDGQVYNLVGTLQTYLQNQAI